MAGVHASLHIMLNKASWLRVRVSRDRQRTYAFLDAADGQLTLSGAPEQIAATLRTLADKVEDPTRHYEEEVG
jgi:hypothetical protein